MVDTSIVVGVIIVGYVVYTVILSKIFKNATWNSDDSEKIGNLRKQKY